MFALFCTAVQHLDLFLLISHRLLTSQLRSLACRPLSGLHFAERYQSIPQTPPEVPHTTIADVLSISGRRLLKVTSQIYLSPDDSAETNQYVYRFSYFCAVTLAVFMF